jgi:hypothetical protein
MLDEVVQRGPSRAGPAFEAFRGVILRLAAVIPVDVGLRGTADLMEQLSIHQFA